MDIYSAESAVQKLLTYVQELRDKNPRMYLKSKKRLRELSSSCAEVIDLISDLLKDEVLSSEEVEEFSDSEGSDIQKVLSAASDKLKKVSSQNQFTQSRKSTSLTFNAEQKRKIVKQYKKVLTDGAMCGIEESGLASNVSVLLSKWFNSRIVPTNRQKSGFLFNVANFPKWIQAIVAVSGNSIETGTYQDLMSEFDTWIEELDTCKYPLPKSVQAFIRDEYHYVSLTSVVLWDLLYSSYLHNLSSFNEVVVNLGDEDMFNMCQARSPNLLAEYVDYHYDPSIIQKVFL